MRPGYLGNLDDFWFGNLSGKHFEILEARSASPIITTKNRIMGKTAEEFKALNYGRGWSTTAIPEERTVDSYQRSPYSNTGLNQVIAKYQKNSQIFKLV
jgi:hypothetical protein